MTIELPEWYSIGNIFNKSALCMGLKFEKVAPEIMAEIMEDYGANVYIPKNSEAVAMGLWNRNKDFGYLGFGSSLYYLGRAVRNLEGEIIDVKETLVSSQTERAIILEKQGIGRGKGRIYEDNYLKRKKEEIVSWCEEGLLKKEKSFKKILKKIFGVV